MHNHWSKGQLLELSRFLRPSAVCLRESRSLLSFRHRWDPGAKILRLGSRRTIFRLQLSARHTISGEMRLRSRTCLDQSPLRFSAAYLLSAAFQISLRSKKGCSQQGIPLCENETGEEYHSDHSRAQYEPYAIWKRLDSFSSVNVGRHSKRDQVDGKKQSESVLIDVGRKAEPDEEYGHVSLENH